MTIEVKVLADSMSVSGRRLVTWELKYPKFIHPQVMTHRQFSRNAQSSRAIPTKKLIENIRNDPAMPSKWGINKRGMEAKSYVEDPKIIEKLEREWLSSLDRTISSLSKFEEITEDKIHKQIINRLLEPWANIKVILSTTFFDNFFHLRLAHDSQPEIQELAQKMYKTYNESKPKVARLGDWHLPLVSESERYKFGVDDRKKISTGRCARVSYLTHDGIRDHKKDIELHDRLVKDGHWSPFEHIATPSRDINSMSGNFRGWIQYRKQFDEECKIDE